MAVTGTEVTTAAACQKIAAAVATVSEWVETIAAEEIAWAEVSDETITSQTKIANETVSQKTWGNISNQNV